MYIDHSVYPDLESPPHELSDDFAKADYVHRICAAWDFDIHPEPQTFELFAQWKDIFDRFPIPALPAYHAFRAWLGWEPLPPQGAIVPPTLPWQHRDHLEGRGEDPCSQMI